MQRQIITVLTVLLLGLSTLGASADTRRRMAAGPAPGGPITPRNTGNTDVTDASTATNKTLSAFASGCTTNCVVVVNLLIRQDPTPPVPSCTADGNSPIAGTGLWQRRNNVGQYCAVIPVTSASFDVVCDWTGGVARQSVIVARAYENVDSTTVRDQDIFQNTGGTSSQITLLGAVATDMMVDSAMVDNNIDTFSGTPSIEEVNLGLLAMNQHVWGGRQQGIGTLSNTVSWQTGDPVVHCAYLLQEAP